MAGSFTRFTSLNGKFEKLTPTNGPGGLLSTPGGKCCCTMNPAVREVNAFCPLLKKPAVPAFAIASATRLVNALVVGVVPFTLQTPSTYPSRSVTAMTLLLEIWLARVAVCAMTCCTSASVSCAVVCIVASRPKITAERIAFKVVRRISGETPNSASLIAPPRLLFRFEPASEVFSYPCHP